MTSIIDKTRHKIFRKIFGAEKNCCTRNQINRENWLKQTLLSIPNGYRILDAGAGELKYKKFCEHLEYISQDFAQYNGKGDGSSLQISTWNYSQLDIVSDITNIPEPDASFDAVMCIEVLEHLPDPISGLREVARLLKNGGTLVLTAPFCSLTHFSPFHFFTGFNRYFYEKHLRDLGFKILSIEQNGDFFSYIAQEIRRITSIANKYCNVRPRKYEFLAMLVVLKMLRRFADKDKNSKELLCFGYHVIAEKSQR